MDVTGAELTSTSMNTTSKQRDAPPPLNVYLRIRPYIGNELERGENQNLIDVLDDKRIAVKLPPTISNTLRNLPISYNEYEVWQRLEKASCILLCAAGDANIRARLRAAGFVRSHSRTTSRRDLHRFQLASLHTGSYQ